MLRGGKARIGSRQSRNQRKYACLIRPYILVPQKIDKLLIYIIMKENETKQNPYFVMGRSRDMFLEERREQVLRRVKEEGRVSVAQLSQDLGVSEVTIRLDLQALADRNLIVRT